MTQTELRAAQKELLRGSREIGSAGMRLEGTEFEADYRKAWDAIKKLNDRLISAINGRR